MWTDDYEDPLSGMPSSGQQKSQPSRKQSVAPIWNGLPDDDSWGNSEEEKTLKNQRNSDF